MSNEPSSASPAARKDEARRWTRRLEPLAYPTFAAVCVLFVAHLFFSSMHAQTHGVWSAPLDDVFIHFDFARATARGFPFQWSEGNGYSSGNTSVSYPFVLALGYWIGFRGLSLMLWAAIVASISVFAFLLVVPRLLGKLPRGTHFLIPPVVLSVGALDWSLFSGMEVSWFLAVWSMALALALRHANICLSKLGGAGWLLGLAGVLIVSTRPEGATAVAALGFYAAWIVWNRTASWRKVVLTLVGSGSPAVAFLIAQAAVNKALTGDAPAAGALVKLALYNPYMSAHEKWENYKFLLSYVVRRNVEYHFSSVPYVGWLFVALGLSALLDPRVRRYAVLLLSSSVSFLLLVALNGQVRWQNERYTMPAVAWFLLLVALGLAASLAPARNTSPWLSRLRWPRALLALGVIALFGFYQAPKFKDQVWFFGRASRNILDQHVTTARLIRTLARPVPNRLLVSDAGALIYASDLPGLDIIGLGGFHGLPIARSSVNGMGATVELLEHMPPPDRPQVMALFPTWWGKFPMLFGRHLTSVWVEGNVICGGAEMAVYAADWHLLNTGKLPRSLKPTERIVDELDVADILSERAHVYQFPKPHAGFVDLRVLSYPDQHSNNSRPSPSAPPHTTPPAPQHDVLDAGRIIPAGKKERFTLHLSARGSARLILRAAPPWRTQLDIYIGDNPVQQVVMEPSGGWVETSLPVHAQSGQSFSVRIEPKSPSSWTNYHVWLVVSP